MNPITINNASETDITSLVKSLDDKTLVMLANACTKERMARINAKNEAKK